MTNSKIRGLLLAALMLLTGSQFANAQYQKKADIVDTAVAAGDFNTLAAALKAAGLIDALKGDGPFTVFRADRRCLRRPARGYG